MTPSSSPDPLLVACAHGTRAAAGRRTMGLLRRDLNRARPELDVVSAHLDVQRPRLDEVVRRASAAGRRMVVVPLLLSSGYHVRVDIGRAVQLAGGLAVGTGPLGPEPTLVDVLEQRLAAAGAGPQDAIVLAAAGSSDPRAGQDVRRVAGWLAERRAAPVYPGYLAAAKPTVAEAVAEARRTDRPVTIASYLLAPGLFSARLSAAGGDRVTEPLAPHPALTELVLRRYDAAAGQRAPDLLVPS